MKRKEVKKTYKDQFGSMSDLNGMLLRMEQLVNLYRERLQKLTKKQREDIEKTIGDETRLNLDQLEQINKKVLSLLNKNESRIKELNSLFLEFSELKNFYSGDTDFLLDKYSEIRDFTLNLTQKRKEEHNLKKKNDFLLNAKTVSKKDDDLKSFNSFEDASKFFLKDKLLDVHGGKRTFCYILDRFFEISLKDKGKSKAKKLSFKNVDFFAEDHGLYVNEKNKMLISEIQKEELKVQTLLKKIM